MTIPQALDLALRHHRAGRLSEAEALYRQILAAHPDHADALHYVGVIAHQVGRDDLAVEWIRRALYLRWGVYLGIETEGMTEITREARLSKPKRC